jgi:hypothetical protein
MNQIQLKKLATYIDGVKPFASAYIYARSNSKNYFLNWGKNDGDKSYRGFRQNVESVIARIPRPDRELLLRHWSSSGEALQFQSRHNIGTPVFVVSPGLKNRFTDSPASGVSSRNGLFFGFEELVVFDGPGEAIQPLIAHEIAHGLLYVKFVKELISLPSVKPPDAYMVDYFTAVKYPPDVWNEELLVEQLVAEWGYDMKLLTIWDRARRTQQKNPRQFYRENKWRLLLSKANPLLRN